MAYKTTVGKVCLTRDTGLAELWTQLAAMGWTLVDGSCTPVTVAYTAVSVANDTFTAVGHSFTDGMPVQLTSTGTAPTGLAKLTQYYIRNVSGDTFKLATTYNGTAINITAQGTGNHTITESYRVYSSNAESGAKIPEYVKISFFRVATAIDFYVMYYYNSTTKATVGGAVTSYYGSVNSNETGYTLWIHGNKDVVVITVKIASAYSRTLFGHLKSVYPLVTALTADATSGSDVTLTVASTVGFEAGSTYQIVGASAEGRDELTVSSITDSTSMVVSDLPRNYATGALIGCQPSTFVYTRALFDTYCQLTCPIKVVGTDNAANYSNGGLTPLTVASSVDPDLWVNKYVLSPVLYASLLNNLNGQPSFGMYYDTFMYLSGLNGLTNEDTFSVGALDTGTSTGSNTTTTLNDTGKSWATDAYAGKVLIITLGTGVGQIKKIASNTATELTLAAGWVFEATPGATSQYRICEEGYRLLIVSTTNSALREGY